MTTFSVSSGRERLRESPHRLNTDPGYPGGKRVDEKQLDAVDNLLWQRLGGGRENERGERFDEVARGFC